VEAALEDEAALVGGAHGDVDGAEGGGGGGDEAARV
jgi:hypothetical protein